MFAVVAVFAFVACGPSSAQIRTARTARYKTTASAAFQAGMSALSANDYKVAAADPVAGKARTVVRAYEADGTYAARNSDDEVAPKDGMVFLAIDIAVVPDGDAFRVEVTPLAEQFRNGYAKTFPLGPEDPAMAGWITGKVDNIYLSIHEALKKDMVAPGT